MDALLLKAEKVLSDPLPDKEPGAKSVSSWLEIVSELNLLSGSSRELSIHDRMRDSSWKGDGSSSYSRIRLPRFLEWRRVFKGS